MTPQVRKFVDATGVAQAAADLFIAQTTSALVTQSQVHVALTGGTVGIASLAALGNHALRDTVDYSRVHFWWGDERFVSVDSRDRNALQAREALLSKITVPEENIHEFPSLVDGLGLDEAAIVFNAEVAKHTDASRPFSFDLVFLGMGPDGHVASLFPDHAVGLDAQGPLVVAEHNSPKPPPERLSFSYSALNAAKQVVFVVAGADKAEAVADAFGNPNSDLPAAKVRGVSSSVLLVDEAAATLLS